MADTRPSPYPADTRARGWRFELDYEQIEQSDTWDMAAEIPMAQHALLMMWLIAWRQEPCGSFPNDEAVIRAKCRIPPKVWAQCRHVLMRGWWLAEDGRLYHDTIAARVLAMLDKRANDAQRAANRRARMADSDLVTPESRVTPPGHDADSTVSSTPSTKHQAPTASLRSAVASACALLPGIPEALVSDYMEVRKAKKAGRFTATAVAGLTREAARAGVSLERALQACCEYGWIGFNAQWFAQRQAAAPRGAPPQSFAAADREAQMQRWEQMTGQVHPERQKSGVVIDLPTTQLTIGARN